MEFDCDIFTNSVTAEFLDDFIVYLEDCGLRHNTIVGYILKIQTLIRRASQYNYAVDQVPCGLCIQYFNKYLKVIMKEIGLNDLVTYSFTKGGKLVTVTREKWELISSHTARRSAATNMYLTGRMKTFEIMKLTGHRSEQNFFRYIRLSGDDTARSISGDSFFRK